MNNNWNKIVVNQDGDHEPEPRPVPLPPKEQPKYVPHHEQPLTESSPPNEIEPDQGWDRE